MDVSSPLAAMRPAPPLFGQQDIFGADRSRIVRKPMGAGSNNVQVRLFGQRQDYFNVKTIRGSSPTASLAADLSQNFRINEASSSPQIATPRRALFTRTNIEEMETREYIATPKLPPSSSPVPIEDLMDMTPCLPHKAPFVSQIELQSPTPAQSPADEMMVDSPLEHKPAVAERKKAAPRRPSLSRAKGYSISSMPYRLHSADNQLPPFQFGGGIARPFLPQPPTSMSVQQCFQETSPAQDRRPQTANSPCASAVPPRPRPHFGSMSGLGNVRNGSPISSHARRPSNPSMRPRKQYRRSLSMFEHPGDIMRSKKEPTPPSTLQSVVDVDVEEPPVPKLPHFIPEGNNDSIPRITRETMLDVLDGKFCEHFDQTMIVDCRFEYEYEGGHINGAINFNDKDLLADHLFQNPATGRSLVILHCEYSAHRAPIMARHVRAQDRTANVEFYPRLTYPDVYILEGGYSGFFSEHRDRCFPQAYVEMDDSNHVKTCEREMDRLRQNQNRKGLHRAQTFAFGSRAVDDSPTAPGRTQSRNFAMPSMLGRDILQDMEMNSSPMTPGRTNVRNVRDYDSPDMTIGGSPILGNDRGHTRRMVSF